MPVLEYHLVEDQYTDAQCEQLLVESSRFYADVLRSPLDRVRVFIHLHKPAMVATAGVPLSRGGRSAPYFHFLALQGRPIEERHALLTGFTELIVKILGADRSLVRGGCWAIPPEDWSIGGTPASVLRAAEVKARAEAAGPS
jgi:4-oxalocrotonate tautomerase